MSGALTRRHNNDNEKENDTDDKTHAHLHVLPPHIFAHAIGTSAEALGRDGKIVGLVLERVQVLTTLGDLVDVFAHHTDGIIDLLWKISCQPPSWESAAPAFAFRIYQQDNKHALSTRQYLCDFSIARSASSEEFVED